MPKIKMPTRSEDENDGWIDWTDPSGERFGLLPTTPGDQTFRMACCGCGLVHDFEFSTYKAEDGATRVIFRARRNMRSTAQIRRHRHKQSPPMSRERFIAELRGWYCNNETADEFYDRLFGV